MDNWSDIIPSIIKLPYSVYRNRKSINYWWKQLQAFSNLGKTNIAVLGNPGTGKSVLTSCLYGEINNLSYNLPKSSKQVENKAITLGEWTHLFRVIPGQTSSDRFIGLKDSLDENSDLSGIIYVTNFGFTEIRDDSTKNLLINKKGITDIESIRKVNLEIELNDFKEMSNKIIQNHAINKSPKWLCIVCNKVDLFLDELHEAQSYYSIDGMGKFSYELNKIQSHIGSNNLTIRSVPVSAYQTQFEWNKNIVSSQITEVKQASALLHNLVQELSNLSDYGH
jgi:hypothetical protein